MELKYVKSPFLYTLEGDVDRNLKKYESNEPWINEHAMASSGIDTSNIQVNELRVLRLPIGSKGDALKDLENTKLLYSDLKTLTLEQAQDHRLWVYLTHVEYWKYMQSRWPPKTTSVIKRRYFFEGSNKDALVRNGISRLWWFGYLTYDENRANPFELTETLLLNQDIQQALLERGFGRNRELLHATLGFIKQNEKMFNSGDGMTRNIQRLGVNINMSGGISLLDCMDREEMTQLVINAANF